MRPIGSLRDTTQMVGALAAAPRFPTKGSSGFLQQRLLATPAQNKGLYKVKSQAQVDANSLLAQNFESQTSGLELTLDRMGFFDKSNQLTLPYVGLDDSQRSLNDTPGGTYYIPAKGVSGLPGTKGKGAAGLQQGFSVQLLKMIAEARRAGFTIGIGGGWRSYDAQVATKRRWEAQGKGYMAAKPGNSRHGWGLAADLTFGSKAAITWAHANAARFGMRFPMSYENWHIEPTRLVRGGSAVSTGGRVPIFTPKPKPKPKKVVIKTPKPHNGMI